MLHPRVLSVRNGWKADIRGERPLKVESESRAGGRGANGCAMAVHSGAVLAAQPHCLSVNPDWVEIVEVVAEVREW